MLLDSAPQNSDLNESRPHLAPLDEAVPRVGHAQPARDLETRLRTRIWLGPDSLGADLDENSQGPPVWMTLCADDLLVFTQHVVEN